MIVPIKVLSVDKIDLFVNLSVDQIDLFENHLYKTEMIENIHLY